MGEEKPRISVIVPVYNVESYLEKCLDSIAAQTYSNMEIIVVDDGSTDGSGKICDAFAKKDKRVQVLHLTANSGFGPSAARNEGVRAASGLFAAFVDADDYVEPNMLERLYGCLAETGAGISVCGAERRKIKNGSAAVYSREEAVHCLARRSPFLWEVWGKLYPMDLVKKVSFDCRVPCGEDLLFFYQILKETERIGYLPEQLYHYNCREGSLMNRGVEEQRCMPLFVLDDICKDAAVDFPEAETGFRQIALDTAARLAMEVVESGAADGNVRYYLKRFRDYIRRHFSRAALAFCPDKKSMAAELALCAGASAFWVFARIYQRMKPLRYGRKDGQDGQSGIY